MHNNAVQSDHATRWKKLLNKALPTVTENR